MALYVSNFFYLICLYVAVQFTVLQSKSSEKPLTTAKLSGVKINWLNVSEIMYFPKSTDTGLSIFCYDGEPKSYLGMFKASYFYLNIVIEEYLLFLGDNVSDVIRQYNEHMSSWFNILPWKSKTIYVPPFNQSCIGLSTKDEYSLELRVPPVDPRKIFCLLFGIFLFLYANKLSHNHMMFYGSGMACGILASILIVAIVFSRFLPNKKLGAIGFLFGGGSLAIFALQYVWQNIKEIMIAHQKVALTYVVVVGCLSLAYCYRRGPVLNPRTYDLIKWTLQAIGLILIYCSCWFEEISGPFIVFLIIAPYKYLYKIKAIWRRRFPSKIKLLTQEEYILQGQLETQKALDELQKYCQSPQFSPWKAMKVLKSESCRRLGTFVMDGEHLTEEEMQNFDISADRLPMLTDDESDYSDYN